jgi:ubiquinone/menaquinone biosynthesis C-methylase UbiE
MSAVHQKGYRGLGMEGWLARWYTRTRRNDLEDFRRQAQAVAAQLPGGGAVLEVAPGPGFFAVELAKLGNFRITALDISRTFIDIATANAQSAGVIIDFRLGNASAMPLECNAFDFVYCSAAFKNFSEPVQAIDEMHRVLRPGGQALIVDLRKDASLDDINAYVKQSGRSRFDAWLTRWAFRCMLMKRAYTTDEFRRMAEQSRFGGCQIDTDQIGLAVRFRKK